MYLTKGHRKTQKHSINELSVEIMQNGKHGIQLSPDILELFLLLFADDVILISHSVSGLQNQLNILSKFSDEWKLTVKLDKTNIVVFRKGGRLALTEKWFYKDSRVQVVNQYKYLGVLFTSKLCMRNLVQDLSSRAKKAMVLFLSTLYKLNPMPLKVFFKLFDTQIQPILLYGSELWGFKHYDTIEQIHLLACKKFLMTSINSPNNIVYGECGRYPLFVNSYIRCIRYWLKILTMHDQRLPRKAYNMLYHYDNLGYKTWASNIRLLLFSNGFGYVWIYQGVGDARLFVNISKERIVCTFCQKWMSILNERSRYDVYRSFKSL